MGYIGWQYLEPTKPPVPNVGAVGGGEVVVTPPAEAERRRKTRDRSNGSAVKPAAPSVPPAAASVPPATLTTPPIKLTAAQFLREFDDDPAVTEQTYANQWLEVSGDWHSSGRVVTARPFKKDDSGKVHGLRCDIDPAKAEDGRAVVVRGRWDGRKDGQPKLKECEVVSLGTPGDVRYRNKQVTVTGQVREVLGNVGRNPLPALSLLLEDTAGKVSDVLCIFPELMRPLIQQMTPGITVTVEGRCKGREYRVIRLESCDFPEAADAMDVDEFVRNFEDDLLECPLRDRYDPPQEDQIREAYDFLGKEELKRGSLRKEKILWEPVALRGKVEKEIPSEVALRLETQTDSSLYLYCHFRKADFIKVQAMKLKEQLVTVVGVYGGRVGKEIRLENCLLVGQTHETEIVRDRITSDYLPFVRNKTTYYYAKKMEAGGKAQPVGGEKTGQELKTADAPRSSARPDAKSRGGKVVPPQDLGPFKVKVNNDQYITSVYDNVTNQTLNRLEKNLPPDSREGYVHTPFSVSIFGLTNPLKGKKLLSLRLGMSKGRRWLEFDRALNIVEFTVVDFVHPPEANANLILKIRRREYASKSTKPVVTEFDFEKGRGLIRFAVCDPDTLEVKSEILEWRPPAESER